MNIDINERCGCQWEKDTQHSQHSQHTLIKVSSIIEKASSCITVRLQCSRPHLLLFNQPLCPTLRKPGFKDLPDCTFHIQATNKQSSLLHVYFFMNVFMNVSIMYTHQNHKSSRFHHCGPRGRGVSVSGASCVWGCRFSGRPEWQVAASVDGTVRSRSLAAPALRALSVYVAAECYAVLHLPAVRNGRRHGGLLSVNVRRVLIFNRGGGSI